MEPYEKSPETLPILIMWQLGAFCMLIKFNLRTTFQAHLDLFAQYLCVLEFTYTATTRQLL